MRLKSTALLLLLLPLLYHAVVGMGGLTKKCAADKERVGFECCTQCGVGFGMISKCYRDKTGTFHDTKCQKCSDRKIKTFSSMTSAVANCEKCRPCNQPSEVLESDCTTTKDTVCSCAPGYFRRRRGPAECVSCAKCRLGEGLAETCNGSHSADCLACQPGHFSAYRSSHDNFLCRPCPTGCPTGYQLQPDSCKPGADAICRSVKTGLLFNATELQDAKPPLGSAADQLHQQSQLQQPRLQHGVDGSSRFSQQPQQPRDWKQLIDNGGNPRPYNPQLFNISQTTRTDEPVSRYSSSRNDMIPVYCAVLGAVIVSLVVWIVFKYFRRRVQDRKVQQQQHFSNALIPPQSPVYPPPHSCQPTALAKRRSIDSGFGGSEAVTASINNSTRPLKEISDSRFQRLENILSNNPNPNGWKELAMELGFQSDEVIEFEAQADVLRQSPIRLMLKSWADRSGSTIGVLSRCLQKVGRKDALILFKESERHHHHQGRHKGMQQLQQPHQQQQQVLEETSMQEMCQV